MSKNLYGVKLNKTMFQEYPTEIKDPKWSKNKLSRECFYGQLALVDFAKGDMDEKRCIAKLHDICKSFGFELDGWTFAAVLAPTMIDFGTQTIVVDGVKTKTRTRRVKSATVLRKFLTEDWPDALSKAIVANVANNAPGMKVHRATLREQLAEEKAKREAAEQRVKELELERKNNHKA